MFLWRVVCVAVAVVGLVSGVARAGQVACADVMAAINREVRARRGGTPDVAALATRIGSSVPWVEHCMSVYGRRPRRPNLDAVEHGAELRLEQFESDEPEEVAPEELEEPDKEVVKKRPERPAVIPPTPGRNPF